MAKYIPESDILTPRDPSTDTNTDEWPEFVLTSVHVHLPGDENAITSLLHASAGYPLTVTGQLEPLDDEDAHLYKQAPSKKRTNIALEDVKTFSYGQYGDGSTALWAAGKAGWYTIKPGRGYKDVFNEMTEAVNILYFIADSYRTPRRKGKSKNAPALPDYTAAELFEKYAVEEMGSSDATDGAEKIYEHREFLISSMISGKEGLSWSKYPLYKHLYVKFPDLFVELRERIAGPVPAQPEEKPAATKPKHKRQASVDTASSTTSSQRRKRGRPAKNRPVEDATDSGSIPESHDPPAVNDDAKSKTRSGRTRLNSVAEPTPSESIDEAATPEKDEDSDEEMRLLARKNKSSLRPKASKASKSAARKSGKAPPGDGDEEIDGAGPLSSPTAGKRKLEETDLSRRHPKRRNSRPHDDEGIDIPTSPSVSGEADATDSPADVAPLGETSTLPLRDLNHVPDPVQEDTWICALDGCTHKVYGASNSDSQRLIREHYKLHAYDDDERVQMIKKLQAPSLPAGRLMERVKQQAMVEGFPGARQMSSRYPMTIPGNVVQKY